jgi:predicted esterase
MKGSDRTRGVRLTSNVPYGTGRIHVNREPVERTLCLDVYEPDDPCAAASRPALIMAFGGAFHRGSKESDEFDGDHQRNTPVAEYCRECARRGYVAFSIDYRLMQEDPDPGTTPVILDKLDIPRSRLDHVREILKLPSASSEMIWAGLEAACDDMVEAFSFVRAHAERYSIDTSRIAVGGFSAGARTALAAAYGERIPAAAVVSISGYMSSADLERLVTGATGEPPAFLVTGEHDLDYIAQQAPAMHTHLASVALSHEAWQVRHATHFYPASSVATRTDGVEAPLGEAMACFLDRELRVLL